MSLLIQVFLIGILPSIVVSLGIGVYLGHAYALRRHAKLMLGERGKTLAALQSVLQSAKNLSSDVDSRTSELQNVERSVGQIPVQGNYEHAKSTLLTQISDAIQVNTRMEDDLTYTRFQLEEQAVELDRTRIEARRDPLSGIGNRKAFDETLSYMLSKYRRGGAVFSLLLIDVDHFKWINDTHGHQSGDAVVQAIGKTLSDAIGGDDRVARYGGDEFAVFFQEIDQQQAMEKAYYLRDGIQKTVFPVDQTGSNLSVTLSMGLAVVAPDDTRTSLFGKCDQALYASKHRGRNRLTCFDDVAGQINLAPQVATPPQDGVVT